MSKLPYKVECRSSLPFFELIAAFDCEPPALAYAKDCARTNPAFKYKVMKGKEVRATNEFGAWK